jgi:hypothetical protein
MLGKSTRRDFVKKAAYVVPTILSMHVALVEARAGSGNAQMGGTGESSPRGVREQSPPERDARRTDRE